MELATVGAVLTYAIKLEGHRGGFYEQAASLTECSPTCEVFLSLAEARKKRQKVAGNFGVNNHFIRKSLLTGDFAYPFPL